MNFTVINSSSLYNELINERGEQTFKYLNFINLEVKGTDGRNIRNPEIHPMIYDWVKSRYSTTTKIQILKYQECENGVVTGWTIRGQIIEIGLASTILPTRSWSDKIYIRNS